MASVFSITAPASPEGVSRGPSAARLAACVCSSVRAGSELTPARFRPTMRLYAPTAIPQMPAGANRMIRITMTPLMATWISG